MMMLNLKICVLAGGHREDLCSLPDHRLHDQVQDLRRPGPPQAGGNVIIE